MSNINTRNFKILGNKKTVIAIGLILLMTFAIVATVAPMSKADNLYSRTTYIFVAAAPNPVGVGQTTYISFIMTNVPPAVLPTNEPRYSTWNGITLTITDPNGAVTNTTNLSTSYAGAGTISYIPSVVGTYSIQASFPGQTITSGPYAGQVYGPSTSTVGTFTASSTPATSISYPLPSAYWTYPIEAQNQGWNIYSGNWLAGDFANASAIGGINPYNQGPYTAHVLWSQPWVTGGLVGGNYQSQEYQFGRWPGGSDQYFCPYIANGIMYQNFPMYYLGTTGAYQPAGFEAVNLATDKVLWTQTSTNDSISYLEILSYQGSTMATGTYDLLWSCSGTTWRTYDPLTGDLLQTITGVTSGGKVTFGPNGELIVYFISANGWLAMWNSTDFEGAVSQLLGWTYNPTYAPNSVYVVSQGSYAFSLGYQWNITIPKQPGIAMTNAIIPNDLMVCSSSIAATNTTGTALELTAFSILPDEYTPVAYNDLGQGAIQADTGNQSALVLWPAENVTTYMDLQASSEDSINCIGVANNGVPVFVIYEKQLLAAAAYNAATGAFMYNTPSLNSTFALFDGESNNLMCADGHLFLTGYDGTMWCFDLATGNLLWSYYIGNSGLNTAYGTWPIDGSYSYYTVAGGVVYFGNNEHSPNDPTWLGGRVFAVNETTGTLLWTIDSVQDETQDIAVADSQALYLNFYDGNIYDISRGPSATTVSAPQTPVTDGQTVTIRGSVMDVSPGAQQTEQKADFPNGLPCVSDASMTSWMNYVYMQKPMPTNATGVQVTLTAYDPNGNLVNIGTTTTDTSGNFGYTWTVPNVPGPYQIIATFSGTQSYWGSSDTTYVTTAAPTATVAPTATPTSVADMYFVPAIAGIIVIVIIGFIVLALLMLRKKP